MADAAARQQQYEYKTVSKKVDIICAKNNNVSEILELEPCAASGQPSH